MAEDFVSSDTSLLDLLRMRDSISVVDLADLLRVTSTAVRQRLNRLMAQGYIERVAVKASRGRPSHRYMLTAKGKRKTGANFVDLAIALWQEVRQIKDAEIRRGLLQRIAHRLSRLYGEHVEGATLEQRMHCVAELFAERSVPFSVEYNGKLPVLTALACPYPELAEKDRSICAMERLLFSEVLSVEMRLNKCRLDGENCCTFEVPSNRSMAQATG